MSEPKLISPLLDGFVMGAAMSDHDGVQCCPAMKENSDSKYIVKIISVPASQKQLDALLLTGAFQDAAAATEYFKELAENVVKEAEFLKKISKLEGFLSYEDWQIVPMAGSNLGYDVYLYSHYKQSLEKFGRKNLMTHLGAVNLGLDLCAALSICRRAGKLYVDLKPTNIFLTGEKEYRIGDLGFAPLDNLKYTSLPSKYRSAYSAPELHDPMVTLNTTADTYSVGMILYQIYNNGKLPFEGFAEAEVYPTPENADYEIAEIIMKAIAPNPADRWADPVEMGRALVAYMQRNTVNDVPITPPTAVVGAAFTPLSGEERKDTAPEQAVAEHGDQEGAEFDFMNGIVSDETAPGEEDADGAEDHPISSETVTILAQAEELLDHEIPAVPAAAPAKPEENTPPTAPKKARDPDDDEEYDTDGDEEDDPDIDPDFDLDDEDNEPETPDVKKPQESEDDDENEDPGYTKPKKKRWIGILIVLMILALLAAGGFYFYRYYYLLPVSRLTVDPVEDYATVTVTTSADPALLTVVCTDIYGNVQRLPLTGNEAIFQELLPDTQYKLHLEVEGFHSLTGSTATTFSTPAVSQILELSAATGDTDGSVVLSFDVEGPNTENWIVTYSAEDEEAKEIPFTGNTVTITGLSVGKTYHFEVNPAVELYMIGENALDYTASAIILPENLVISDYGDGKLTAQWTVAEGNAPEYWVVRCYSGNGEEQVIECTETSCTFENINSENPYTIEVAAKGMTQAARAHVSANPTTVTQFHISEESSGKLVLTWEFDGSYPEGGWLVMYTVDGLEKQILLNCEGGRAEIFPFVPSAHYDFTVQSAGGSSVFNGNFSHTCAEAEKFTDYEMYVHANEYNLCKTPANPNWTHSDVKRQDYTTTFASGDSVSMIIASAKHFIPRENVTITYAIRDENGKVLAEYCSAETVNWYQLWADEYPFTTLDIPKMPKEAGNYQLCLYFNSKYVTVIDFTITE